MKRRDWRTKKSKKNIYGKLRKDKRIFFLRTLFLRKNSVFLKKNFVPHFFFYNKMIKNFYYDKNFIINILYNKSIINYLLLFPNFSIRKKIFYDFFSFKKLLKLNELDYYSIKKNNYFSGNNLLVFDKNNNLKKIENCNIFINEDEKKFNSVEIKYKFISINKNKNNLNFFVNYNLFFLNNLEIYKIIILLYVYNLK